MVTSTAEKTGGPAPLWGVKDTAAYLGLPVPTIYAWHSRGQGPPAYRIGRWLKYDPAEVEGWVRSQTNPRAAA